MKSIYWPAIAAAVATACIGNANAATEIWNMDNTVLTDGTSVTGSFGFDAATDTYSNINLKVGGTSFGIPDPVSPGNSNVLVSVTGPSSNYTGTPLLAMNWATPLTSAGGQVSLNTSGFSFYGACASTTCNSYNLPTVSFLSGSVTTAETWYLQNAVLSNGLAVTGSFAFDPVSGSYSNINVKVGSTSFGIPDPVSPGNSNVLISVTGPSSNYTGTPLLAMNWVTPLTPTGGQVDLNTSGFSFYGACAGTTCNSYNLPVVSFVSGLATTAPVPEPESLALLFAGLGLMGTVVRRRKGDQA